MISWIDIILSVEARINNKDQLYSILPSQSAPQIRIQMNFVLIRQMRSHRNQGIFSEFLFTTNPQMGMMNVNMILHGILWIYIRYIQQCYFRTFTRESITDSDVLNKTKAYHVYNHFAIEPKEFGKDEHFFMFPCVTVELPIRVPPGKEHGVSNIPFQVYFLVCMNITYFQPQLELIMPDSPTYVQMFVHNKNEG